MMFRPFSELASAARRLSRSPVFLVGTVGTLGIGLGVNTALFGVLDALLLRPPAHVQNPDRVVRVLFAKGFHTGNEAPVEQTSYPSFEDIKESGAFAGAAAYASSSVLLGWGADATEAQAMIVTPEFFRVLGVRPKLGMLPAAAISHTEDDDRVVLSEGFWKRQFGADPHVLGRRVVVDGSNYVIVGIVPSGFTSLQTRPVDIWLPISGPSNSGVPNDWRHARGSFWLAIVARLKDGTSPRAASLVASAAVKHHNEELGLRGAASEVITESLVRSRASRKTREVQVTLWLVGVATSVLLLVCANVSNLLLARGLAKRTEYAVRRALGATDWHVRRHVMAEVVVIALCGAGLGLTVESLTRAAIPLLVSVDTPMPQAVIDGRVTIIALAGMVFAGVFIGGVALTQLRRTDSQAMPGQPVIGAGLGRTRSRHLLLVMQAALCTVLLFFAGLFAKSLRRVEELDLGVDLKHTIQVSINLDRDSRPATEKQRLYDEVKERLKSLPEVDHVAIAEANPYMHGRAVGPFTDEKSFDELWRDRTVPFITAVGSEFFASVGATSLRGRDFSDADRAGAPLVAIINAPLAEALWPGRDALGRCVWYDGASSCARVIGVLGGVWKFSVLNRREMVLYVPLGQDENATAGSILLHARGDPRSLFNQIRSVIRSVDAGLPPIGISLATDLAERDYRTWRLGAELFSIFGVIAAVVATIGLYSVVAFNTALRTSEIGLRIALGAPRREVFRVVAGDGLMAVLGGLLAGVASALIAGWWVGDLLYKTSPGDTTVLFQTALLLLLVASIGVVAPVLRVLQWSPLVALRTE